LAAFPPPPTHPLKNDDKNNNPSPFVHQRFVLPCFNFQAKRFQPTISTMADAATMDGANARNGTTAAEGEGTDSSAIADIHKIDAADLFRNVSEFDDHGTLKRKKCAAPYAQVIKELSDTEHAKVIKASLAAKGTGEATHVCRVVLQKPTPHYCNALLKLRRNKPTSGGTPGAYISTIAAEHLRRCHPEHPAAERYMALTLKKAKSASAALQRNASNLATSSVTSSTNPPPPALVRAGAIEASFMKTITADAKADLDVMCMHLLVYGDTVLPVRFFESRLFRALMAKTAALGRSGYVPITRRDIPNLVKLELARQMSWFKNECAAAAAISGGRHMQVIHDAGTPANGVSFNVVAVQQVSPAWDRNDIWTLACRPPQGKSDVDVAADIKAVVEGATGSSYDKTVSGMMQDGGAKGTATLLGYDAEDCMLHSPDKVGSSAIGRLVRTKKKKVINPFPGAQAVFKRARKVAGVFSWHSRRALLYKCAEMLGLPRRKPQLDNETRMNSVWSMLVSLLVQKAALKAVWSTSDLKVFKDVECLEEERDIVPMIEMESILAMTRTTTIIGQCEKYFVGAVGILTKILCLKMLRHDKVLVLDCDQLERGKMVRKTVPASTLTKLGETCKRRAILEAERRWCGNTSDTALNDEPPIWSNDQKAAAVLDLRVVAEIKKYTDDPADCFDHFYEEVFKPEWMRRHGAAEGTDTEPEADEENDEIQALCGALGFQGSGAVKEDDAILCERAYKKWMPNWLVLSSRVVKNMNKIPLKVTAVVATAEADADANAESPAHSTIAEATAAASTNADAAAVLEVPITEMEAELWRLIKFDIAPAMLEAELPTRHGNGVYSPMYGFLPALARRYLGRLQSESYCERVISFLGQVSNDRTVAAKTETIGDRVVVHMNKAHAERHGR
jgi:hypothetical protein